MSLISWVLIFLVFRKITNLWVLKFMGFKK